MSINVALDGPAGAGKSTIAKALAAKLDYVYVDTGAMYRGIALYMIEQKIDIGDLEAVAAACDRIDIEVKYEDGTQVIYLDGRNVNGLIRTEAVSQMASKISAIASVRARLLELQRSFARDNNVIMDGRDIGTHVLPNADVKIYMTASSRVRATRRFLEYKEKNIACDIDQIEAEIIERDTRDMNREIAPLKQAEGAVFVDTSDMTIREVIDHLYDIVIKAGESR